MDDSRGTAPDSQRNRPCVAPAYLLVLLAAAVAGVALMHHAAGAWHDAQAAGSFTADVRRTVVFALLFNVGMGLVLALVALGELVLAVVRLARKAPAGRVLLRLLLAIGILAAFGLGHGLANPWLRDLSRALATSMQGV